MPLNDLTITTACDTRYFWGAFLMVGSLRRHGTREKVHVLGKDLTEDQKAMLAQFDNVAVLPLPPTRQNMTTSKPEALLSGDSEWLAWIDADCMCVGDISPLLRPPNGEFQIRVRGEAECINVYRSTYFADEPKSGIARHVLEGWKKDVGDLESPRLTSLCVANVFVIHARHRAFIELWRDQMGKVLAAQDTGVVDHGNPNYKMTDESVLNSLLIWSSLAPKVSGPYLLDQVDRAHLAHFAGPIKPWHRWTWRALNWYEPLLDFIGWCHAHGYRTPPIPWTFKRRNKSVSYLIAAAEKALQTARTEAGSVVRAQLRKP